MPWRIKENGFNSDEGVAKVTYEYYYQETKKITVNSPKTIPEEGHWGTIYLGFIDEQIVTPVKIYYTGTCWRYFDIIQKCWVIIEQANFLGWFDITITQLPFPELPYDDVTVITADPRPMTDTIATLAADLIEQGKLKEEENEN
jgi:translation elongation factor EF-4